MQVRTVWFSLHKLRAEAETAVGTYIVCLHPSSQQPRPVFETHSVLCRARRLGMVYHHPTMPTSNGSRAGYKITL